MMRSLFSAISGLRNHQVMMDTVGNNIANVNTTGFKSARVTFQDIISQTLRGGTAPSGNLGGQNPMQVGLGVQLGTIDTMIAQGNLQATGRPADLALQGDGYFVLSDNATTNPIYSFTRDGNLELGLDPSGGGTRPLLHAATGLHVKGWMPPQAAGTADTGTAPTTDITIPTVSGGVAVTSFQVDSNGIVSLILANGTVVNNHAQLAVALFPNAEGLSRAGNNLFQSSVNSGAASYNGAAVNARGAVSAGFLEMSNVDLAKEFSNLIIAERGFQANSRVITASDEILQDVINIKR
jgi:flagellar hook protein FlgE